jgi:DNA-binding MarR family transcriptional regulator
MKMNLRVVSSGYQYCQFSKLAYNMLAMKRDLYSSVGFIIHDVARQMRWSFDRQSQGLGLTRAQWVVLAHLKRSDGVQQKTLAELMDVKPITLARHIDRLEMDGLVRREDDPHDRRAKRVFLTGKAAPMMASLQKLGQKVRKQAMQGITPKEEQQLIEILLRIRNNLSESEGGANE